MHFPCECGSTKRIIYHPGIFEKCISAKFEGNAIFYSICGHYFLLTSQITILHDLSSEIFFLILYSIARNINSMVSFLQVYRNWRIILTFKNVWKYFIISLTPYNQSEIVSWKTNWNEKKICGIKSKIESEILIWTIWTGVISR